MAKKPVQAASKPSQQKSKEEQWRKRMAAQARTGAATGYTTAPSAGSAVTEPGDVTFVENGTGAEEIVASGPVVATSAAVSTIPNAGKAAAAPVPRSSVPSAARRPMSAPRANLASRARIGAANQMSLDEEMHYIRSDIRRLIILTAICLVILIALAIIIPLII